MKNHYSISKLFIVSIVLIIFSNAYSQVQLNQLTTFGSAIYSINNTGKGVHGNGYYDFTTNTSSAVEAGVVQTVANNNADQVLGLMDDGMGNYIPAFRNAGFWNALPNMDENYTYTLYDVSENGIWIVGQTNWTMETGAWGFIYNRLTATFTLLSSSLYEYGAAYSVNNNGIAVGWVDDLPSGTVRMPAYFKPDGSITLIKDTHGEADSISENNVIVGNFGGKPFIYNLDQDEFKQYSTPDGYMTSAFSDISENGIAVGYAEKYVEGEGFSRDPIIFHEDLGAQPLMLKDVLTGFGIDSSTLNGQVYKISRNGNYLAGWTSGPATFATGWSVYLDNILTNNTSCSQESVSTALEEGNDITGIMQVADDFVVTAGKKMTIKQVKIKTAQIGGSISSIAFTFYKDEAGLPGEITATASAVAPTSLTQVGDYFGFPVYEVLVDLPTPVVLSEGTYWLQPTVTGSGTYWGTSQTASGNKTALKVDSSPWQYSDMPSAYSIFEVSGNCEDIIDPLSCSQESVSTALEEGNDITGIMQVADDFIVSAGKKMTIKQVKIKTAQVGGNISSVAFNFYKDEAGLPGEITATASAVAPTSLTQVGDYFGFPVYEVLVDLPTPVVLSEGTYWLQPTVTGSGTYWGTSQTASGNKTALKVDSSPWQYSDMPSAYSIFEVSGICEDATMAVSDPNSSKLSFYPNPVKDILNIASDKKVKNISVFNTAGQLILTTNKVMNGQVNLSSLQSGVYVLSATLESGEVKTFRIIKK